MNITQAIQQRTQEIQKEILKTVDNQSFSLTQKNLIMQPLIDEHKVLQETLEKLEAIKNTNYFGLCSAKH